MYRTTNNFSSTSSNSSDTENTASKSAPSIKTLIHQKPLSAFRLWCLDNDEQFIGKHAPTDLLTKMKTYWRHHTSPEEKEEYYKKEREMKQKYYAGGLSGEIPSLKNYMKIGKRENPMERFREAEETRIEPPLPSNPPQEVPAPPAPSKFDPNALHTVHYASRTPRSRSTPYPLNPVQNNSYFSSKNPSKNVKPKKEPDAFGDADLPVYF